MHFPFCFLIRVSGACECRENLKRLCSIWISTNLMFISTYLLQAHFPGFKAGEISRSAGREAAQQGLGCRCAQEALLHPEAHGSLVPAQAKEGRRFAQCLGMGRGAVGAAGKKEYFETNPERLRKEGKLGKERQTSYLPSSPTPPLPPSS